MLSNVDKEKVLELRRNNLTYKAIRAETGFALQTISNVIKEDKDNKDKGEADLNKNVEDDFLQDGVVSFDSSIDKAREIMGNIQTLIDNGNLQESDRREWKKRLGDLQALIRVEVEYKISGERHDAANNRDVEWQNCIDQDYVPKEVAENLESIVISQNASIEQINNVIVQKDAALVSMQNQMMHLNDSHQMTLDDLNDKINNYYWEIQRLVEENWYKYNVILNYQYYYDHRDRILDHKEIKLIEAIFEADKKHDENKRLKMQLDDESEVFKKRKVEFEDDKKQLFNAFNKRIKSVEKREINVEIAKKIVLTQKKKNDLDSKKIQNETKKLSVERENINKAKEELQKAIESFNKQKQAFKKNHVRNVVLKPYKSNSKLIS